MKRIGMVLAGAIVLGSIQSQEVKAQNCVNFWIPPGQTRPVCFNGNISYGAGRDLVYVNTLSNGDATYLIPSSVVRYASGVGKFTLLAGPHRMTYQMNCKTNTFQFLGGQTQDYVNTQPGGIQQMRSTSPVYRVVCPRLK